VFKASGSFGGLSFFQLATLEVSKIYTGFLFLNMLKHFGRLVFISSTAGSEMLTKNVRGCRELSKIDNRTA
jgi:hypothetical protein